MHMGKAGCDLGMVVCSFLAAVFWLRASLVKAPRDILIFAIISDGGIPAEGDVADAVRAMWTQSQWNAIAAGCACAGALLLGVSTLIGVLSLG